MPRLTALQGVSGHGAVDGRLGHVRVSAAVDRVSRLWLRPGRGRRVRRRWISRLWATSGAAAPPPAPSASSPAFAGPTRVVLLRVSRWRPAVSQGSHQPEAGVGAAGPGPSRGPVLSAPELLELPALPAPLPSADRELFCAARFRLTSKSLVHAEPSLCEVSGGRGPGLCARCSDSAPVTGDSAPRSGCLRGPRRLQTWGPSSGTPREPAVRTASWDALDSRSRFLRCASGVVGCSGSPWFRLNVVSFLALRNTALLVRRRCAICGSCVQRGHSTGVHGCRPRSRGALGLVLGPSLPWGFRSFRGCTTRRLGKRTPRGSCVHAERILDFCLSKFISGDSSVFLLGCSGSGRFSPCEIALFAHGGLALSCPRGASRSAQGNATSGPSLTGGREGVRAAGHRGGFAGTACGGPAVPGLRF